MVKLIRLLGDDAQSNIEIRNNFVESINLPPGSKMAVRSATVDLIPDTGYNYNLSAPDLYTWKPNVPSVTEATVTVPAGSYSSLNALHRAMNIAANSTGQDNDNWYGLHNIWKTNTAGYTQLEVYKADLDETDFTTNWVWLSDDGLTKGAGTLSSSGVGNYFGFFSEAIPLSSNELHFSLVNTGEITFSAVPFDDSNTVLWQVGVYNNGGTPNMRVKYLNDVGLQTVTGAYTLVNTDQIELRKYADKVIAVVYDAAGVQKEALGPFTLGQDALVHQLCFYYCDVPTGSTSSISGATARTIETISPLSSNSSSSSVEITLTFLGLILWRYLRFDIAGPHIFSGDPAILSSNEKTVGVLTLPSVLLTVDGLELESYLGKSGGMPSAKSVLDVIYVEVSSLIQVRYQASYPLPLNIKNAFTFGLRNLTLRFENEATGKPLQFIGKPVVVLEIYGPDDK